MAWRKKAPQRTPEQKAASQSAVQQYLKNANAATRREDGKDQNQWPNS